MKAKQTIDVLHVIPNEEDYVFEEIKRDISEVNALLGGQGNFVKLTATFGFYCKADITDADESNFVVIENGEVLHDVSGPAVFTRIFNDCVPTGISHEDAEILVSNLVQASWGRVLFLDRLSDLN